MDPSEYDLEKTEVPISDEPQPRSYVPWVIGAAAVLAVGMLVWFFMPNRQTQEPAAEPPPSTSAAVPPEGPFALCEATDTEAVPEVPLPPLDESDALVAALAGTLSEHPRIAAWLATDGLIRNITVVVENIANGVSPAAHLSPLQPAGVFRVTGEGEELFLDPRSYERFALVAAAIDSVDVQGAVRLCGTLKPRLDEAYEELGSGGSFDGALERAIVALLRTPAIGGNVRLAPNGDVYTFRDETLESLTPAQKHLARTGAVNTRLIQDKLRQLAQAIGIPRARLPDAE